MARLLRLPEAPSDEPKYAWQKVAEDAERPHLLTLSGEEMHVVLRALLADGDVEAGRIYNRLWDIAREQSADDEQRLAGRALQEIERFRAERRSANG